MAALYLPNLMEIKPTQDLMSLKHHICYFDLLSFDKFFGEEKLRCLMKIFQLGPEFFSSATLFLEGRQLNFSSPKKVDK